MAQLETTPAVVLRRVEYGDKDIIVTLYGRDVGKLGAIAKNARASKRRFGGGLQPMRLLRAHLERRPNRDLARLDSIDVIEDFPALETNFDRLNAGSYATELLRELTIEEDPDRAVFEIIVRFFKRLSAIERPLAIERLVHQLEYQLLLRHGTPPAVRECLRCGRSVDEIVKVRALRSGEGVVCDRCIRTGEQVGVLAQQTVDVLAVYAGHRDNWPTDDTLSGDTVQQARRFMVAAVRRVLDQPLNTRDAIGTLFDTVDSE